MPANNLSDKKTKMNGKKKKNDSYVKKKIIFGLLFIEKNANIQDSYWLISLILISLKHAIKITLFILL